MAQGIHAAFEFQQRHPHVVGDWLTNSNYLVVLSVPDEAALFDITAQAAWGGLMTHLVREPDLGDEATALAIQPGIVAQKLCASLPLALKYTWEDRAKV